jgi:hypothetical protein
MAINARDYLGGGGGGGQFHLPRIDDLPCFEWYPLKLVVKAMGKGKQLF